MLLAVLLCGISIMSAVVLRAGLDTSDPGISTRTSEAAVSRDAWPLPVPFAPYAMSRAPPRVASVTLQGPPTFVALDNDGDSLANQLLLRVPLHVDVPGVYWFVLTSLRGNAFGPVNKYLNLSGGDAMVVIPLSGITLRSFTGNLSVDLQVAFVTESGWTYELEWQGVYAIPDPTYFQTAPAVDVTVRVTGPSDAVFNANLELWNASNAFTASIDIPVGIDVRLSLPQLDYVVLAWTNGPGASWQGLVRVHPPTLGTVDISTNPAGPFEDGIEIGFTDWTRGEARSSRTFRATPSARFFADVTGDGDGVLTDSEIATYTFWRVLEPASSPVIHVDSNALVMGPWGAPVGLGGGPVVSATDLGVVRPGPFVLPVPNAGPHRVRVEVPNPREGAVSVVTFLWPPGWVLAGSDNGHVTSPIGEGSARIEVQHDASVTGYDLNLTVVPITDAPGSIRGGVIEAPSPGTPVHPVADATVRLFASGILIAQAISDSNGEFVLAPVPPGIYLLRVSAAGYEPGEKSVTVGPFQAVSVDQLALAPTPAIAGSGSITFVIAGAAIAAGLLLFGVYWPRVRRCAPPPDVLRESPSKDVLESGRLRVHHPRDRAGGETIAQSPSGRGVDPAVREPPRVVVQNLFVAAEEENRQRLLFENRAGPERICEGVHLRGVQGSMVLRECRDNGAHRRHAQSEGRHRRANIRLEIRRSRRLRRLSKFLNELTPCGRDVEHHRFGRNRDGPLRCDRSIRPRFEPC